MVKLSLAITPIIKDFVFVVGNRKLTSTHEMEENAMRSLHTCLNPPDD